MKRELEIYSIANCGVLISTPETTILVDGIFKETQYFDGLSASIKQKMLDKESPFQQIDYLLFTHNHKDHLDYDQLVSFLKFHPPAGVFLPWDSSPGYSETVRVLQEKGIELVSPDFGVEDPGKWGMKESELMYFFSPHSGKEYRQVNHFALLIETPYGSVYFSGDSDFFGKIQVERLKGSQAEIAFFNPYHLNSAAGRNIIVGIGAKDTFIYHIPPEEKDHFSIRRQAIRDIEKHREALPPIRLVLEQEVYLSEKSR